MVNPLLDALPAESNVVMSMVLLPVTKYWTVEASSLVIVIAKSSAVDAGISSVAV